MNRSASIVLIAVTLVVLLAGCNSSTTATSSSGDIQIVTATRGDIKQEVTPSGSLVMPNVANLTFGGGGTVKEVAVEIGDKVTKGQVLAKLDPLDLEKALIQAKISYRTAQMTLERAQTPSLSSSGSSSAAPDPVDIEIKQLQVQSAKIQLDQAQTNYDEATIIAPFDGIIGQVNPSAGDTVAAGTVIIRIVDPTRIQVNAYVNEMDVFQIKVGAAATVGIDAISTTRLPATVFAIAPSATASGGVVNYLVKLNVKIPSTVDFNSVATSLNSGTAQSPSTTATTFKEGLTVSVTITVQEKNNVILVPTRAVTRQGRNSIVQVVKADGTIEQRTVTTGVSNAQNVEISDGLNEGEKVLISKSASPTTQTRVPIIR